MPIAFNFKCGKPQTSKKQLIILNLGNYSQFRTIIIGTQFGIAKEDAITWFRQCMQSPCLVISNLLYALSGPTCSSRSIFFNVTDLSADHSLLVSMIRRPVELARYSFPYLILSAQNVDCFIARNSFLKWCKPYIRM